MRKILTGIVALTIALMLTGCACAGTVGTATPSPTAKATNSPAAGGMASAQPSASAGMTTSPDASASPGGASASTSPEASASPGGGSGETIPNFTEGKEVEASDAPKVKEAVEKKYPGAEIKSIKHQTQDGKQGYVVTVKVAGSEKTVFVTPDGTLSEGASSTPGSGS